MVLCVVVHSQGFSRKLFIISKQKFYISQNIDEFFSTYVSSFVQVILSSKYSLVYPKFKFN